MTDEQELYRVSEVILRDAVAFEAGENLSEREVDQELVELDATFFRYSKKRGSRKIIHVGTSVQIRTWRILAYSRPGFLKMTTLVSKMVRRSSLHDIVYHEKVEE
jgi:hypothetical protein